MKVFAINDTEWIAAESEEDALEYEGLERDEVTSIEEIPETEWDEEIEVFDMSGDEDDEGSIIKTTIRRLMTPAAGKTTPAFKILTENF